MTFNILLNQAQVLTTDIRSIWVTLHNSNSHDLGSRGEKKTKDYLEVYRLERKEKGGWNSWSEARTAAADREKWKSLCATMHGVDW